MCWCISLLDLFCGGLLYSAFPLSVNFIQSSLHEHCFAQLSCVPAYFTMTTKIAAYYKSVLLCPVIQAPPFLLNIRQPAAKCYLVENVRWAVRKTGYMFYWARHTLSFLCQFRAYLALFVWGRRQHVCPNPHRSLLDIAEDVKAGNNVDVCFVKVENS